MDEKDFWWLAATIGLLAVLGILQSKILARHDERIVKLGSDVAFLMDRPPVSHETEER